MFSKCVRNVWSFKQSVNVAKNLISGRSISVKSRFVLTSKSYRGHSAIIPARCVGLSKAFSDQANVAQNYTYSEDAEEWTKVNDTADKTTGDFKNFRLSEQTITKLRGQGIQYLFPVQSNTFNVIYDEFDVIVQARTGSGKTMSYAIPLVEKLLANKSTSVGPKMLVLAPTRELANQVAKVVESLTNRLKVVPVYGGASINMQESQLRGGADIVVGTPGRIMDLMKRGSLRMTSLEHVVLDEVDRMLDMGFADDVDTILKSRYRMDQRDSNPQTLLFSATVPHWVRNTAKKYLSRDLKMLDLIGEHSNRTAVNVQHKAMLCSTKERTEVVLDAMRRHSDGGEEAKVIVFCQTKREVDSLGQASCLRGKVGILHGDISQAVREATLNRFKNGSLSCLVATDVAARGLDVPDVDVVIQCSPPMDVESYIHRSGRTGRAGKSGESILLYTPEEAEELAKIEGVAGFTFEKGIFKRSIEDMKIDIVRSLRNVSESTKKKFEVVAKELMEGSDPAGLLASAMAVMSGYEQKSLITLKPGLTTYLVKRNDFVDKTTAMSLLPEEFLHSFKNVRICKDRKSFVLDVPVSVEKELVKSCKGLNLQPLESLPPLEQALPDARRWQTPYQGHDRSRTPSGYQAGRGDSYHHRRSQSSSSFDSRRRSRSDESWPKRSEDWDDSYRRRRSLEDWE